METQGREKNTVFRYRRAFLLTCGLICVILLSMNVRRVFDFRQSAAVSAVDPERVKAAIRFLDTHYAQLNEHVTDSVIMAVADAKQDPFSVALPFFAQLEVYPNRVRGGELAAEILLWLATSKRNFAYKEGRIVDAPPIEEFGAVAARYFDHEDIFVREMASWAVSIKVNNLNNDAVSEWPGKNPPSWYDQWLSLQHANNSLTADYVRHAVSLSAHRSPDALVASAKKMVERGEALKSYIDENGDPARKKKAREISMEMSGKMKKLEAAAKSSDTGLSALRNMWLALRTASRELTFQNPDMDFEDLLFATRHSFHSGGNITNGAKSFSIKPGGDIYIKSGLNPTDPVKPLIGNKLRPGHMQGMDLWYDADRIVFSYTEQPDYFNEIMMEADQGFDSWPNGKSGPPLLYEMELDKGTIRQLTFDDHNSDVEPSYLPSGDIVFSSSRSDFGSQCSGHLFQNKKIVNLYRIGPDGQNMRSLSNNKDFDRHTHIMDNGMLLYTRWEYQERHLWQTHNLWTGRPDGTYTEAIFKQHNNGGPMSLRDARQIPGSNKLVAIGAGHHEWEQGAVFIIDYQKGTNEEDGFRIVTPEIAKREGGLGNKKVIEEGGVIDKNGLYMYPYPLSEKSFLTCFSFYLPRANMNASNFGLYYIDVYGNKELIHNEPILSVAYPYVLRKRTKPPVIPDLFVEDQPYATTYVTNIYQGVPDLVPGSVKYIRISHNTEWPAIRTGERVVDYNHLHYTPSGSWSRSLGMWTWSPTRVIGTVPVEEDGSAHFKVPVNIPVYFQALDKDYLELRRMRTFVTFQPGEVRGCTGCHESRDEVPPSLAHVPKALSRDPDVPKPPVWSETALPDFAKHIQPIFEKHCVGCHNTESPAGGLEFTSRKVDDYLQSYRTLFGLAPTDPTPVWEPWSRKLMHPDHENVVEDKESLRKMENNKYPGQLISISNRFGDASVSQVKEFGSTQSKLIQTLLSKYHQNVTKIDEDEWVSLVTWIDMNAPYWGTFVDKEPAREGKVPQRVEVVYPKAFDSAAYATKVLIPQ